MAHTAKAHPATLLPINYVTHSRRSLPVYLIETALPLFLPAVGFLAVIAALVFSAPAQACEWDFVVSSTTPATVSYTVTDDPRTSDALGIPRSDNLDYELDHVRTDETAELGCDLRTLDDGDATLTWYECTVPASEAPQA